MIKHKIIYIIILLNSIFLFSQKVKLKLDNSESCSQFKKGSSVQIRKQNDSILGLYVLKSCENLRFKIVISKKENQYLYKIFDNKKTIAKGKSTITKNKEYVSIMLGLIGGIFSGSDIQIQNYGNAMNEFIHFTQCDEKYLTFVKKS